MNALWVSTFALPDWDMFSTDQPAAEFHAAARAISGSPIYVSDPAGRTDVQCIRKLTTSDGRTLHCKEPALPTRDCLFVNCYREERLLKVFNRNGSSGVLALLHCLWLGPEVETAVNSAGPITDNWTPTDIEGIAGETFAAWNPSSRELRLFGRRDKTTTTLSPLGFEIWHIVPIENGVAPLGLLDKLNSTAAVEEFDWEGHRLTVLIRDGGDIGFYANRRPCVVCVNGKETKFDYDPVSHLLRVTTQIGINVVVDIQFV